MCAFTLEPRTRQPSHAPCAHTDGRVRLSLLCSHFRRRHRRPQPPRLQPPPLRRRRSPPAGGKRKAKKAKTKTQRAASVQQPAFVAREESPPPGDRWQQLVTEAQVMDAFQARCMQVRSEQEQMAAEQGAGQQAAPEMQQKDILAQEIDQPIHPAEEPSVGAMEGQWWMPQDGTPQAEEINSAPVQQGVNFSVAATPPPSSPTSPVSIVHTPPPQQVIRRNVEHNLLFKTKRCRRLGCRGVNCPYVHPAAARNASQLSRK